MIDVPPKVRDLFDSRLAVEPIPGRLHGFYRKWLRFYWDFCQKQGHDPSNKERVRPFLGKLSEKRQLNHSGTGRLVGHSYVRTTMIYTHTIKTTTLKEKKSPLDF